MIGMLQEAVLRTGCLKAVTSARKKIRSLKLRTRRIKGAVNQAALGRQAGAELRRPAP
ncbi:hypothetical protein [Nonomuraea solani]|uniref:hypothetical protein n=1 Tax=Nonomuraea solani TaxID=1144553 RepID=UPI0013574541|nr:hypothetical protein [Nonomuraea solani]